MPGSVIPFVPKKSDGPATGPEGEPIIDHGTLGSLSYEIYERGVIHIFNDQGLRFKKALDAFEDELNQINFDDMFEGDDAVMKGSGDNDNLVFSCKGDEVDITLSKRGFDIIEKLRSIITAGKSKSTAN